MTTHSRWFTALGLVSLAGLLLLGAPARLLADEVIDDGQTLTIDGAVLLEPYMVDGALHVGTTAAGGTLDILNGGDVISDDGTVAGEPGSVGAVNLTRGPAPDYSPSAWQVSGSLHLAGSEAGPGGTATVAMGPQTTLQVEGDLYVHSGATIASGSGTLAADRLVIEPGAFVDVSTLFVNELIGFDDPAMTSANNIALGHSGGRGYAPEMLIDTEAEAALLHGTQTVIGYDAPATMRLDSSSPAGATRPGYPFYLGMEAGGDGRLIVEGPYELSSTVLRVGAAGRGELTIRDGATVRDAVGVDVGYEAGSRGEVNVIGPESFLSVRSLWWGGDARTVLYVGVRGEGTLRVLDGGTVDVFGGVGVAWVGDRGEVLVDGVGSSMTVSRQLDAGPNWSAGNNEWELSPSQFYIEYQGAGRIDVTNGGLIVADFMSLAAETGREKSVLVDGVDSVIDIGRRLGVYVGGWVRETAGATPITVSGGGTLSASMFQTLFRDQGYEITIDDVPGYDVLVTGSGSQFRMTGESVADGPSLIRGPGRLRIEDGGAAYFHGLDVEQAEYYRSGVGYTPTPPGQWTVDGPGSVLHIGGFEHHPQGGSGDVWDDYPGFGGIEIVTINGGTLRIDSTLGFTGWIPMVVYGEGSVFETDAISDAAWSLPAKVIVREGATARVRDLRIPEALAMERARLAVDTATSLAMGDNTLVVGNPFDAADRITMVGGSLAVDSGAVEMELGPAEGGASTGGLTPGSDWDQLLVFGEMSFGGTLDLLDLASLSPRVGDRLVLIYYGSRTGAFEFVIGNHLGGRKYAALEYGANLLSLVVTEAIAGDLNGDGATDTEDINPFVLALTDPAAYAALYHDLPAAAAGDFNGDGLVDTADINDFVAALTGAGVAVNVPAINAAAIIPEPAVMLWMGAAMIAGAACRTRRGKE